MIRFTHLLTAIGLTFLVTGCALLPGTAFAPRPTVNPPTPLEDTALQAPAPEALIEKVPDAVPAAASEALTPIAESAPVEASAAMTPDAVELMPAVPAVPPAEPSEARPVAAAPAQMVVTLHRITPELVAALRGEAVRPRLNAALEREISQYEYRIGAGDMLSFAVWGHPEMSSPGAAVALPPTSLSASPGQAASQTQQAPVSPSGTLVHRDGSIFFPYVGVLNVDGMTISELRRKLTKVLDKYIQYPQVDVTVTRYESKKVYVTGAVVNIGSLPITSSPLTILDAVSQVGGFKENADIRNIVLIRNGEETTISLADLLQRGDLSQNRLLQSSDLLYFPSNSDNKVFVLGEVDKRNVLPLGVQGTSLGEALAASGGISEITAKPTGVFVLRSVTTNDTSTHIDVFQLDAREPTAYVLADKFQLKPRDFIYVTAAPITLWNRVLNQLLPSLTSLLLIDNLSR